MKKYAFFILALINLIVFNACNTATNKATESLLTNTLDSLIQPYIDNNQTAGLVLGVAKNDSLILLKSYGYADLDFKTPMPKDASFEIGSVTKQFTAVAIMQLVDEGKLSLKDDLRMYIDFDTKGRNITIKQLLNHTSGIKAYTEMPIFGELSIRDLPRDTLLRLVEKENFTFEPGTAMIYNNTAFFMLGLIIEKASNQSYEDYIAEHVFKKAKMNHSYYCDEYKIVQNKAYGYDMNMEGKLQKASFIDQKWPYAAGSLGSNIEDMLKWNYFLHETEELLPKDLYAELIKPSELNDGRKLRYSKGLSIAKYHGHKMISHEGAIPGFIADSRYFPDQKLAIVVLINTLGRLQPTTISNTIADILLPKSAPEKEVVFEGDLNKYKGSYSGAVRGRNITLIVKSTEKDLVIDSRRRKDTLSYVGNYKWSLGNRYFSFGNQNGETEMLYIDSGYGYYVLKKDE